MNKLTLFGVALAVILAGAGCNRAPVAIAPAPVPQPVVQVPADDTGVEAAVAELEAIAKEEDDLVRTENNDAQEPGDDRDQLNVISESSYELR